MLSSLSTAESASLTHSETSLPIIDANFSNNSKLSNSNQNFSNLSTDSNPATANNSSAGTSDTDDCSLPAPVACPPVTMPVTNPIPIPSGNPTPFSNSPTRSRYRASYHPDVSKAFDGFHYNPKNSKTSLANILNSFNINYNPKSLDNDINNNNNNNSYDNVHSMTTTTSSPPSNVDTDVAVTTITIEETEGDINNNNNIKDENNNSTFTTSISVTTIVPDAESEIISETVISVESATLQSLENVEDAEISEITGSLESTEPTTIKKSSSNISSSHLSSSAGVPITHPLVSALSDPTPISLFHSLPANTSLPSVPIINSHSYNNNNNAPAAVDHLTHLQPGLTSSGSSDSDGNSAGKKKGHKYVINLLYLVYVFIL